MASDEIRKKYSDNSRLYFLSRAKEQREKEGLCVYGLFMVQTVLIEWLHYAPGEEDQVKKAFDDFGGDGAVGQTFAVIKRNADEGLKVFRNRKGERARTTWLTLTDGSIYETKSYRSTSE